MVTIYSFPYIERFSFHIVNNIVVSTFIKISAIGLHCPLINILLDYTSNLYWVNNMHWRVFFLSISWKNLHKIRNIYSLNYLQNQPQKKQNFICAFAKNMGLIFFIFAVRISQTFHFFLYQFGDFFVCLFVVCGITWW